MCSVKTSREGLHRERITKKVSAMCSGVSEHRPNHYLSRKVRFHDHSSSTFGKSTNTPNCSESLVTSLEVIFSKSTSL